MPALLARMREVAPGIHLRLYNSYSSRLFEDLDADEMDLAIGYGVLQQGEIHHKRRKLFTETWLCMFNAEKTGIIPPISLDDYVRLPHVLTSLRPGRNVRGIVDEALEKLGLRRSVALTTSLFLTVPSFVVAHPSLLPCTLDWPVCSPPNSGSALARFRWSCDELTISLLWHASYDHDPAHAWLRELVAELAAKL